MVIIITDPILFAICLALAAPYVWMGYRALTQSARELPAQHGLRDLGER